MIGEAVPGESTEANERLPKENLLDGLVDNGSPKSGSLIICLNKTLIKGCGQQRLLAVLIKAHSNTLRSLNIPRVGRI